MVDLHARQVLQQVSALVPLASTLTHLNLCPLHQWEGRPGIYSEETLLALRQLTRCELAALGAESCTQYALLKVSGTGGI
jgi:hypothetical protein